MPHIEHCHWHLGSVGEIVIADIGGDISIDTGCCGTRYEVGRKNRRKGRYAESSCWDYTLPRL